MSNNFKATVTEICSNIYNKNYNTNETYFNVRLTGCTVVAEIADRTALEIWAGLRVQGRYR